MYHSKIIKIVLIILVVAALGFTGYFVYEQNRVKPEDVLEDSFKKLSTVSSWTTSMESVKAPFQIKVDGNFHKNELSLISIQYFLDMPPNIPAQNFKIDFAFNEANIFLGFFYSNLESLLAGATKLAPEIEKYQTYQLILPILRGEKWLHVAIPEGAFDKKAKYTPSEKKDNEKIANSFKDALVYRKFDRNFEQDGETLSRITIGLNKKKLLKALDILKDSPQLEADISDFNKFIESVKAIESWDSDLIEILVQKDDGMLRQISLNFPGISREELLKLAKVGSDYSESVVEDLEKIDHIFVVKFDNYNTAPAVPEIVNFVEVDPIIEAAKVELLPLLGQYLQAFGAR